MNKPRENAAERRARWARLSLRLLPVLCTAAGMFLAPAAQAKPLSPKLIKTNPTSSKSSPVSSSEPNATEPLIVGEAEPEEKVITEVVSSPRLDQGPSRAGVTAHPEYEIELFAEPNCKGRSVSGTASELESPGIRMAVTENSVTEFSARQVDPITSEASECSEPLAYWEGSPPPEEEHPGGQGPGGVEPPPPGNATPPPAPHLRTVPGGRANDSAPLVTGTAPEAATVKIFENAACSGAPVAKGSAAQFAAGLQVQVAENRATSFYGVSVGAGGGQSTCSAPVVYVEDSTPPHTRITMGPGAKTRRSTVVFRFTDTTGDEPGTVFYCRMDHSRWRTCRTPFRAKHLSRRRHVFQVTAVDPYGNREAKPVKQHFKVIR
jgi:hypothetical protein